MPHLTCVLTDNGPYVLSNLDLPNSNCLKIVFIISKICFYFRSRKNIQDLFILLWPQTSQEKVLPSIGLNIGEVVFLSTRHLHSKWPSKT